MLDCWDCSELFWEFIPLKRVTAKKTLRELLERIPRSGIYSGVFAKIPSLLWYFFYEILHFFSRNYSERFFRDSSRSNFFRFFSRTSCKNRWGVLARIPFRVSLEIALRVLSRVILGIYLEGFLKKSFKNIFNSPCRNFAMNCFKISDKNFKNFPRINSTNSSGIYFLYEFLQIFFFKFLQIFLQEFLQEPL